MTGLAPTPVDRIQAAFAAEEAEGQRLFLRVRMVLVVITAIWLPLITQWQGVLYWWALLALFIVFGYGPYKLRRRGVTGRWPAFLFATLDMLLLTLSVLVPNPMQTLEIPAALFLRFSGEHAYYIFIAAAVFSYSPRLVVWNGVMAVFAYTAGVALLLRDPAAYAIIGGVFNDGPEAYLRAFSDPNYVDLGGVAQRNLFFLMVAGTLAYGLMRFRRLVYRSAEAERARSNLARYFSPAIADTLAARDEALTEPRSQEIAVLFADAIGFTAFAAGRPPREVMATLRDLNGLLADAVFAERGTLDKYLGDGIMATFGTPEPAADDADRALACARRIITRCAGWNAAREARGEVPLRIGVGVHFGTVTLGDTGDANRMEYAVIGDTVNVASRIEHLTRDLGCSLVISNDLYARITTTGLKAGLIQRDPQQLRGRSDPIVVWTLSHLRQG